MPESPDTSPERADDDEWIKAVVARALLEETRAEDQLAGSDAVAPSTVASPPRPTTSDWSNATPLDTASIRSRAAAAAEATRRFSSERVPTEQLFDRHDKVAPAPEPPAVDEHHEPRSTVHARVDEVAQNPEPPKAPAAPDTVSSLLAEPETVPAIEPETVPVAEESTTITQTVVDTPPQSYTTSPQSYTTPPQSEPQQAEPQAQPQRPEPVAVPAQPSTQQTPVTAPAFQPSSIPPFQEPNIEPARVDAGFEIDRGAQDGVHPADELMSEEPVSTDGYRASDLRTIFEWLLVIGSALAVALLIKAFVLQAFWIPSPSMETTVNEGDRILVNKLSYRLHEVRRGDLVVFKRLEGTPGDTDDLIKRVIALPGETIEVRDDGRIWIWGPGEGPDQALLLEEPYLDPQNEIFDPPSASDPLSRDIWDDGCANNRTPGRCTLDDSSFFMLGDNRRSSADSRFFGPIPEENVVGRAFFRIWPLGDLSTL